MTWLDGLNEEQVKAALHQEGPLLILAGAGSGKTTTLVSRTGLLMDSGRYKSSRMAVLTFTNKAARELKQRVGAKLAGKADGLWCGTFHSFGLYLLRRYHTEASLGRYFGIIDQSDCQAIIKELLLDLKNSAKDAFDIDTLLSIISRWREVGQKKATSNDEYEIMVEYLLPKYLQKLKSLDVVDFDSLLLKPLELMKSNPKILKEVQNSFDQIMVDEFQDTNLTQMDLIDLIVKKHQNITVVGDDDQSIYGWRGAQVANIINFPKRYKNCKVIRLEKNYRSSEKILNLANYVISKNSNRHDKKLIPTNTSSFSKPELFIFENDDLEVEAIIREIRSYLLDGIAPKQIAVLYRSNSQGAMVEVELRKQKIAYKISGGTAFFDRKEIKDILSYIRCSLSPNDLSLKRVINTPSRGIGDTSIEQLSEFSKLKKVSFFKALQNWSQASVNPKTGEQINNFLNLLKTISHRLINTDKKPGEELVSILEELGYYQYIRSTSRDIVSAQKRINLIEAFSSVMDKLLLKEGKLTREKLLDFLNFMELKDHGEDEASSEVQLMTLHASKGLEFDAVILMGLDEDILPHKSLGEDIQEERRLFYVGITRARKKLVITRCRQRKRHGRMVPMTQSRFITDLPEDLITVHSLGWRPVTEDQRKSMLTELFKKLEA